METAAILDVDDSLQAKPVSSQSPSLRNLANLIQAVETYYNPSNRGRWTYSLARFLQYLAFYFLRRWRREHEDSCTTPGHRRLTPELRREFVLILRNVTFIGMFSKDHSSVGASNAALKYMSILEPNLIFPGLLERIYPALEAVTESHRTASCIEALSLLAHPLLSRQINPAGAKHIPQLLHLILPGIDMNDASKAMSSLLFVTYTVMNIRLGDVEHDGGITAAQWGMPEEQGMDQDGEINIEQENALAKASTAGIEEWVANFFRRLFTILENLPEEHRGKGSSRNVENNLVMVVHLAADVVCSALSDELYDMTLKLVVEFAVDNVSANSLKAIGSLISAIAKANPEKAMQKLLPICIAEIKSELENGASSVRTTSTATPIASDTTLHWYQSILHGLLAHAGSHALNHKSDIVDVLDTMLSTCKSERGYTWSARILKHTLVTLTSIYPKDWRCVDNATWNSEEYKKNHHLYWGDIPNAKELNIDWHVPTKVEIAFAFELLDKFGSKALHTLEELIAENVSQAKKTNRGVVAINLTPDGDVEMKDISGTSTPSGQSTTPGFDRKAWSNDFCRYSTIVKNCIAGMSSLVYIPAVPEGESPFLQASDDPHGMKRLPMVVAGYSLNDPTDPRHKKYTSFRDRFQVFLHSAVAHLRDSQEDNVESVKMTIRSIRTVMTEFGCEKSKYETAKKTYLYGRDMLRTAYDKKSFPRYILIRRAQLYHLKRLRRNATERIMRNLEKDLVLDLAHLSLSTYTQVRLNAQSALEASRCYLGITHLTAPILLEALRPPPAGTKDNSDRMKGALYLLTNADYEIAMTWDWRYVRPYINCIINAQHEEKPSIQDLIFRKAYAKYYQGVPELQGEIVKREAYLEALDRLEAIVQPSKRLGTEQQQLIQKDTKRRLEFRDDECIKLEHDLLSVATRKGVHWRYSSMAASFLHIFQGPAVPPSPAIADFLIQSTVSEMPNFRSNAIVDVAQVLTYVKLRSVANADTQRIVSGDYKNPLIKTVAVDWTPDYTQKVIESFGQDIQSLNPSTLELQDDIADGWMVWGKEHDVYRLPEEGQRAFDIISDCRPALNKIRSAVNDVDYWTKLIGYVTLDTNHKHTDKFNANQLASYVKKLFKVFEDDFLSIVQPEVETLCAAADEKNKQRAAAELLAGILRGVTHWSLDKQRSTWDWAIPLLRKTLLASNPETLTYWVSAVEFTMKKRDPRRMRPLIELILSFPLDPAAHTAFDETKKLHFVKSALTSFSWHFIPFSEPIIETYLSNLSLPYKQVREIVGSNLGEAFQIQWHPSYSSIEEFMDSCRQRGDGVGMAPRYEPPILKQRIANLVVLLDKWHSERRPASEGPCDYFNGGKTVLVWLMASLMRCRVSSTFALVLPFLPELMRMQDIHDEPELVNYAKGVATIISRLEYPPDLVEPFVDKLIEILDTTDSWHTRARILPIVQIFFFRHLFLIKSTTVIKIMERVFLLLTDSKVEVRQAAAVTLSGLIRCSQREAITSLRDRSSQMAKTPLPKRKRATAGTAATIPEGYSEAILQRHAGVLGLSCIIDAFPYDVPAWMPSMMIELAGFISDPVPIQTTVRNTFANFRRTHLDTWAEDSKKFTEDQLAILMDVLISPNYYA